MVVRPQETFGKAGGLGKLIQPEQKPQDRKVAVRLT